MEIINLFKVNNGGKLKATFTVETPKLSIRDFKLVEGENGELWAAPPSRTYQDRKTGQTKWVNIVSITDVDLLNQISLKARAIYVAEK